MNIIKAESKTGMERLVSELVLCGYKVTATRVFKDFPRENDVDYYKIEYEEQEKK